MQRYQIEPLENGKWVVTDHHTGKQISDLAGSPEKTLLEAQALADFRNAISPPPAQERVSTRLQTLRRTWALLTARRTG